MNIVRVTAITAAAVVGLAACATLSEEDCRGGNWSEIGFRDGSNGRSPDFLDQHAKACSKFGVGFDQSAWEAGRQEGLKSYCTARNAYREGSQGRRLRSVCPAELQNVLVAENERGRIWYDIGRDIADAERDIRSINNQLATLAADDPARAGLMSRRSFLRLDILHLRARRARYM